MKQIILMASAATLRAGCATVGPDYNKVIQSVLKSSFESKHIATVDRLEQDAVQAACSEAEMLGKDLDPAVRVKLEAAEMATIKQPADGNYFGDWTKAERIAQSGNGHTWKVLKAGTPNGGNCYNCHQITKK